MSKYIKKSKNIIVDKSHEIRTCDGCIELIRVKGKRLFKCNLFPSMIDMIACYKYTKG